MKLSLSETEFSCRQYLDYAENQARKGVVMYMDDWVNRLDAFLQFNDEAILKHKGKVSQEVAKKLAEKNFEEYKVERDKLFESDFDKSLKQLEEKRKK